jgi:hypothetical protein
MYSTRCTNCNQLITLRTEDMLFMIQESEAQNRTTYQLNCPKCRRPVKIQLKVLKMKVPRPAEPKPE